jgi:hypothetical protein
MAPESAKVCQRASQKRKLDDKLRSSKEFLDFLCDTPFASTMSEIEKFNAFLQFRANNKPPPKSAAE